MYGTRVAVVRGGPSSEYEVSMNTGARVLKALKELGYDTRDIVITRKGEWLVDGKAKDPEAALLSTDKVFIAMHGAYGEDGTIQKILERLHLPFTGSNSFPSSLAFNKDATKRALNNHQIKTPKYVKITPKMLSDVEALTFLIKNSFGPEYVIKPTRDGSSHGVEMVSNISELTEALIKRRDTEADFMIEERIRGREATCALLEGFRDQSLYVLPAIEIIPPATHDFFAEDVKYSGTTTELVPGRFSFSEKAMIAEAASIVHTALGLSQYSRSDFIIKEGEVFFLEVNTLPGLTEECLYPKATEAIGLSYAGLIDHLIKTARVY